MEKRIDVNKYHHNCKWFDPFKIKFQWVGCKPLGYCNQFYCTVYCADELPEDYVCWEGRMERYLDEVKSE